MRKIFKYTTLINFILYLVLALVNTEPDPGNWVQNDFNYTIYVIMFLVFLLPPVIYYPFWIAEWEQNRKNRANGTNKW